MTDFALLYPHPAPSDLKLLRAAGRAVGLDIPDPIEELGDTRLVLSVGKAGLDVWHDFGLVQVGTNHGDVFRHRSPVTARSYIIMVVEHPGAMAQQQIQWGAGKVHLAREAMARDLGRWVEVLDDGEDRFWSELCGGCMKAGKGLRRMADHWLDELDGVGLCEDHYRARSKYKRKRAVVPVKDRGKIEHQIKGQREMFGGDGTKVMVDKR